MQFRRTFLSASIFALLTAVPCLFADEASRTAKVEELFRVAQIDKMMQQQMAQGMDQVKNMTLKQIQSSGDKMTPEQTARFEQLQSQMMALVQDAFSWDKLKPQVTAVYVDTYTDDELDGLLTFYKSPAGQAFVQKTPQLMTKTMELMMQRMSAVQPQIQSLLKQAEAGKNSKSAPSDTVQQ